LEATQSPVNCILLIDDDYSDAEFLSEAVKVVDSSIKVLHIQDPSTASWDFENKAEKPDVIFLDLNMPLQNGIETLRLIKQNIESQNIPIVIYTIGQDTKSIEEAYSFGADYYFIKPNTFTGLVTVLTGLLKSKLYVRPQKQDFVINTDEGDFKELDKNSELI
jgi:DNA-binding NarL/FixJ family response regulator